MKKLFFYTIPDSYIEYLREKEPKVALNKNEKRPYIGPVLTWKDVNYYAPLTSPKDWFYDREDSIEFMKITEPKKIGNEKREVLLGAVNLLYMIPVPERILWKMEFLSDEYNDRYKRLLQKEYRFIKKNSNQICKNAEDLMRVYSLHDTQSEEEKKILSLHAGCDMATLTWLYDAYLKK